MTLYNVLQYPDERLRLEAEPVVEINKEIQKIIANMLETMYESHGAGLAATQVNIQKQIIVIDISPGRNQPIILINPIIIKKSETLMKFEEGCLSLPGISAVVERPKTVTVKALNREGEEFIIESDSDYLSACLQHEIDHLHSILYIDHLSPLKQKRLIKKMEKIHKSTL